ncbi:MAG: AraC family transcriptional regulator [Victivallaceae bacterium]|nr:AraC family transcriptional regulator [Victivallaceae bacterium]
MKNKDPKEILLFPERWNIISSSLPLDVEATPNEEILDVDKKDLSRHENREILIPLLGEYKYAFRGKYYDCDLGNVFLIDKNDEHEAFYTDSVKGLVHIWLNVTRQNIMGSVLRVNHQNIDYTKRIKIDYCDLPSEMNLYNSWDIVKQKMGTAESLLSQRKFMLSLSWTAVKIYEALGRPWSDAESYQKDAISAAKIVIEDNLQHDMSVKRIARMAGYSQFHFSRLFKEYTGITVSDYINICREKRMIELRSKNVSSKEISELLGFASSAAYYNWLSKKRKTSGL